LTDLAAAQQIAAQQGATLIELRANSDLALHSKASWTQAECRVHRCPASARSMRCDNASASPR